MRTQALVATQELVVDSSQPAAPQLASVLLVIQGSLLLIAGLSAIPFGIVEPWMRVEALLTLLLAASTFWLARGVRLGRRRARRWTLRLQVLYIVGSLLLAALPLDALRGPVPLLTNLALPMAIFALLAARSTRALFVK